MKDREKEPGGVWGFVFKKYPIPIEPDRPGALIEDLESADPSTVLHAARALSQHGDIAVEPLLRAARKAAPANLGSILSFLEQSGASGREALVALAEEPTELGLVALACVVRTTAEPGPALDRALEKCRDLLEHGTNAEQMRALGILTARANDARRSNQHAVEERLREPLPLILRCLESDDDWLATTAVEALIALRPSFDLVAPHLEHLLEGSAARSYQLEHRALQAVTMYGPQSVRFLPSLSKRLTVEVGEAVITALEAIGAGALPLLDHAEETLKGLDDRQKGSRKEIEKRLKRWIKALEKPKVEEPKGSGKAKAKTPLAELIERLGIREAGVTTSAQTTAWAALNEARELNSADWIPDIEQLLAGGGPKKLYGRAVKILGFIVGNTGDARGKELLLDQLDREELSRPQLADLILACEHAQLAEALPRVTDVVQSRQMHTDWQVEQYFETFHDETSLQMLGEWALKSLHRSVISTLNVLCVSGSRCAVPYAEKILVSEELGYRKKNHQEARLAAIAIIATCGDVNDAPALGAELRKKKATRGLCVKALYDLGTASYTEEVAAYVKTKARELIRFVDRAGDRLAVCHFSDTVEARGQRLALPTFSYPLAYLERSTDYSTERLEALIQPLHDLAARRVLTPIDQAVLVQITSR